MCKQNKIYISQEQLGTLSKYQWKEKFKIYRETRTAWYSVLKPVGSDCCWQLAMSATQSRGIVTLEVACRTCASHQTNCRLVLKYLHHQHHYQSCTSSASILLSLYPVGSISQIKWAYLTFTAMSACKVCAPPIEHFKLTQQSLYATARTVRYHKQNYMNSIQINTMELFTQQGRWL